MSSLFLSMCSIFTHFFRLWICRKSHAESRQVAFARFSSSFHPVFLFDPVPLDFTHSTSSQGILNFFPIDFHLIFLFLAVYCLKSLIVDFACETNTFFFFSSSFLFFFFLYLSQLFPTPKILTIPAGLLLSSPLILFEFLKYYFIRFAVCFTF